jgi:hypothetical protein
MPARHLVIDPSNQPGPFEPERQPAVATRWVDRPISTQRRLPSWLQYFHI